MYFFSAAIRFIKFLNSLFTVVEKQPPIDDAELIDMRIRFLGEECHEKLRAANVLLIKVRGLGSEIAKDIILCGIKSLTILDDGIVTEDEIGKNFLLSRDSVGMKIAKAVLFKAQALNPLVQIVTCTDELEKKDEHFYKNFTIVIGTGLNRDEILKISKFCRDNKVKFISGHTFGTFGFSIADFQIHDYFEDQVKFVKGTKRSYDSTSAKFETTSLKLSGNLMYPKIEDVLTLPEAPVETKRRNIYFYLMLALLEFRNKHSRNPEFSSKEKDINELKNLKDKIFSLYQVDPAKMNDEVLDLIFEEVVPVCSIIGGVITQEVVKAVSGKEVPIHNVFLLDPFTYDGREEKIGVESNLSIFSLHD